MKSTVMKKGKDVNRDDIKEINDVLRRSAVWDRDVPHRDKAFKILEAALKRPQYSDKALVDMVSGAIVRILDANLVQMDVRAAAQHIVANYCVREITMPGDVVPVLSDEEAAEAGQQVVSLADYQKLQRLAEVQAMRLAAFEEGDEVAFDTQKDDKQMDYDWSHLKTQLASDEWTASEHFTFRGFFTWGWEAARQCCANRVEADRSASRIQPHVEQPG